MTMGLKTTAEEFNELLSDIDKKFNGDYYSDQDVACMIEDLLDLSQKYNEQKIYEDQEGYRE